MHALDVIYRILRTRVNATVEEHEQIMAAFNDIAAIVKGMPIKVPVTPQATDEIPMPGKVSARPADQ